MKLVPLFKLTGRVNAPTSLGRTISGTRTIYSLTGGEFEGERLHKPPDGEFGGRIGTNVGFG